MNLDDEDDLGALNFQMARNSVVGASSGRGIASFKYRASGVGQRCNPEDTAMLPASSSVVLQPSSNTT